MTQKLFIRYISKIHKKFCVIFGLILVLICLQAVALFKSYFGGSFDEDAIRNNFVLIYELLDGMWL